MSLNIETRRYRLTGITPILGSQPCDPAVRTSFIASKAPSPSQADQENELLPNIEEKGLTVFLQRPEDNAICLMDYMLIGFFKAAAKALAAQNGVKQAESKIGTYVFVEPRTIPLMRDGEIITDDDGNFERPLRAQTIQGPRVTLTSSERVNDPWSIEIAVKLIENEGTAKSKPITWETLENALDYGALKGLGQWRNGGYGRFIWESIDEK